MSDSYIDTPPVIFEPNLRLRHICRFKSPVMLRSPIAAVVLALASVALAAPTHPLRNATEVGHICGSTPGPEYIAAAEAHFAEHEVSPEPIKGRARVIYVCFHVIYKNKSCVSLLLNGGC